MIMWYNNKKWWRIEIYFTILYCHWKIIFFWERKELLTKARDVLIHLRNSSIETIEMKWKVFFTIMPNSLLVSFSFLFKSSYVFQRKNKQSKVLNVLHKKIRPIKDE